MKRLIFRRYCSLFIFVMIFSILTMIPAAAQQSDREVLSEIDAYLRGEMEKAGIPGAALGVIKDGEVFYLKGYGLAGDQVTAVTAQTSFAVGSLSKSFTAMAVLQLYQSGELMLDDPVTEYLPWLKVGGGVPAGDITIRHLLNQTGRYYRSFRRSRIS